jgi:hypothetical protein
MNEFYFFDIPIFRCNIEKWGEENDKEKNKLANYFYGYNKDLNFPYSYYENMAEKSFISSFNSYFYSELVGMLRIRAIDQQIEGELWFIKQNPNKKPKNKTWRRFGSKFKFNVFKKHTNSYVFEKIMNLSKNLDVKGFVDLSAFKNAGKYIDYLSLLDIK